MIDTPAPDSPALPDEATLRPIEEAAVAIAREGGALILDRFRSALNVEFKAGNNDDPVTEVDRAVEAMVLDRVKADFPDHAVLGEEGTNHGAARADYVWAIDPLDGTTNFINGLGMFCCSIGVLWRGVPVAGALFLPGGRHVGSGVYHARRGGGAFFEDERFVFRTPTLPVGSRISSMPAGLTGVDGRKGRHAFGTVRTLGSSAAELVLTAEGTFQVGVFHSLRIWDVAAGAAICQEAGAAVWVRRDGGQPWRELRHFRGDMKRAPSLEELRGWNDWLAAGEPSLLPDLPRDLLRAQSPLAVAKRMIFGKDD